MLSIVLYYNQSQASFSHVAEMAPVTWKLNLGPYLGIRTYAAPLQSQQKQVVESMLV